MTNPHHPDDLVTLITKPGEFEANTLVAVLAEAGIEAFAFGIDALSPLGLRVGGCPVQVRHADLDRAKQALAQNVADSVDLDWDEIDVGQREDNLPLSKRATMPWPAKIGFGLAMLILIGMLLSLLLRFCLMFV